MANRKNRDGQVLEYHVFTLNIPMPAGQESCKYCPCLKYDRDRDCRVCKLTYEVIESPELLMGICCPLIDTTPNKEDAQDVDSNRE